MTFNAKALWLNDEDTPRYRSVTRASPSRRQGGIGDDDIMLGPSSITVIEDDTAIETGLLDQHGNRIVRQILRAPIGFRPRR